MLMSMLTIAHLIGLSLAVGSATTKLFLLINSRVDQTFVPVYAKVAGPITRLILLGTILLILSGIGWIAIGYPLTAKLVFKLVLVAAIVGIGATMGRVIEPKFRALAPGHGTPAAHGFSRVQAQYLALEITATLLFYAVIVYWVLW
jgi:hypothetical protein